MNYVYLICALVCFAVGAAVGHRFFPRTELREISGPAITTEVEKIVTKTVAGDVTTRFVERRMVKPVPAPAKPQYRLGALLPIGEPKDVSVTAGRRLVGDLWVESQYNIKRKEILVGVSYEW